MGLRDRYRVAWDDGEPVEVRTSARDIAAAQDHADRPAFLTMAIVYSALERNEIPVPPFEKWVDVLDKLENLDVDGEAVETVDPTLPAGGGNGP